MRSILKVVNNQRGESAISLIGAIVGGVIGFYAGGGPMGAIKGAMWGYSIASAGEMLVTGFPSPPDLPSIGDISSTYNGPQPAVTTKEGIPIARAYGRCNLAGNKIRINDNTESDIKILIGHCAGPVSGILSTVSGTPWYTVNDVQFNELTGTTSHNFYSGTTSQLYDSRFMGDSYGAEIISSTSCASDFFTAVTAPWYHDAVGTQYNINGSQVSAVRMSLNSAVTKQHWYRAIMTIGNYDAGNMRFGFGGASQGTWRSGNTIVTENLYCDENSDGVFYIEADSSCSASLQYLSLMDATGRNSAYRGVAYSAFTFEKNQQTGWWPNINAAGDWLLCTPIGEIVSGASDKVFSRNPAVVMYDWYVNIENYSYYEMNIAEFRSLETYCDALDAVSGTSRYTFDYVFDTKVSINDAKKIIWNSFNGCCIWDQGKLKPVWESGKANIAHAFTLDNIVKGSFNWSRSKVPNVFRIYYIDGDNKWEKTSVELKDEESVRNKGEILHEENCWFINNKATAKKRLQFVKDKADSLDWLCTLKGFSDSGHLEPYDRVTVTHPLPGWTAKDFIVKNKSEDTLGRPEFALEAFYADIYHGEPSVIQSGYSSTLPSPYETTAAPTNISASLTAVGTSFDNDAVRITFTAPNDTLYAKTEAYISTDDSAYYFAGSSFGADMVIQGMGMLYQPGDTVYIKLRNINTLGVKSPMPSAYDTSVVITGSIRLGSFYAGLYDFWGGGPNISGATTTMVLGNLDGTPKIALGASADAITYAGTESGFIVDGSGNLRSGATQSLKWNVSTSRLTIGEWIVSPNGIADNFTEANATILLDKTNARIQLGASAGNITFAGTESGFYVDGSGYFRVGGSSYGLRYDPTSGILDVPTKVRVGAGATYIDIDGTLTRIVSSDYVSGVFGAGFLLKPDLFEVGNIACRGMIRTAVFQKDVVSAVGGNLVVLPADILDADMSALDIDDEFTRITEAGDTRITEAGDTRITEFGSMTIGGDETFYAGDIIRIKEGTYDEWFEVINISQAPVYGILRDMAGGYGVDANPAWKKGASVVNFKQSGDGAVYMTASETNAPYLSVFTHAGSPWSILTTRLRLGNLNGFLGYTSDIYGIAIGADDAYLKYDPTNGLRIRGSISGSSIQGGIIVGSTIKTSMTGKSVMITSDGITLLATSSTGKYSGFKYGSGTKYGSGAVAYIHHISQNVPFYVSAEQTVADFHYFNRTSNPSGAAEIGETAVVNGELMICTVAGTPGTWTIVGTQS